MKTWGMKPVIAAGGHFSNLGGSIMRGEKEETLLLYREGRCVSTGLSL